MSPKRAWPSYAQWCTRRLSADNSPANAASVLHAPALMPRCMRENGTCCAAGSTQECRERCHEMFGASLPASQLQALALASSRASALSLLEGVTRYSPAPNVHASAWQAAWRRAVRSASKQASRQTLRSAERPRQRTCRQAMVRVPQVAHVHRVGLDLRLAAAHRPRQRCLRCAIRAAPARRARMAAARGTRRWRRASRLRLVLHPCCCSPRCAALRFKRSCALATRPRRRRLVGHRPARPRRWRLEVRASSQRRRAARRRARGRVATDAL